MIRSLYTFPVFFKCTQRLGWVYIEWCVMLIWHYASITAKVFTVVLFFCMVLHVILKWFQRPYNFEGGIAAMNEWYVQLQALCINDCQCVCIVTVIFKVQRRPTPLSNCRMVNSYTCVILWVLLEAYCYEDSKYVINFMIGCELATIPPYLIGNPGQNSKPFSKYNVGLHH